MRGERIGIGIREISQLASQDWAVYPLFVAPHSGLGGVPFRRTFPPNAVSAQGAYSPQLVLIAGTRWTGDHLCVVSRGVCDHFGARGRSVERGGDGENLLRPFSPPALGCFVPCLVWSSLSRSVDFGRQEQISSHRQVSGRMRGHLLWTRCPTELRGGTSEALPSLKKKESRGSLTNRLSWRYREFALLTLRPFAAFVVPFLDTCSMLWYGFRSLSSAASADLILTGSDW